MASGNKTVTVTGSVTGDAVAAPSPQTLTITDDDESGTGVTLVVEPNEVMEDAGSTEIRVRATLAGGARSSMTLLTVTIDEDEYTVDPASLDLEIPAEHVSAEGSFLLTPIDDAEDEGDRRVAVTGVTNLLPVTGAAVTIRDDDESNEPPRFNQQRYEFNLQENRSGRDTPVVLGTVAARDSDGNRIRYALFNGDRDRFTVSRGGTVSYIGAGEDFETGPDQFEMTRAVRQHQPSGQAAGGERPPFVTCVPRCEIPAWPQPPRARTSTGKEPLGRRLSGRVGSHRSTRWPRWSGTSRGRARFTSRGSSRDGRGTSSGSTSGPEGTSCRPWVGTKRRFGSTSARRNWRTDGTTSFGWMRAATCCRSCKIERI